MTMRHLILGGARSGKTRAALNHAAERARRSGRDIVFVATARAQDVEMSERIVRHRAERPATWRTVEAPTHLAAALSNIGPTSIIVVDCLTLWLSNALLHDFNEANPRGPLPTWDLERASFFDFLHGFAGELLLVSNEVGSGIVPMSALARRFQDEQGWLNQRAAEVCDRVSLVVAGLEIPVKGSPSALS
jgi:adenosylcobinamide kinase / adenosylcobinamide-phosphate guanylyltransferase